MKNITVKRAASPADIAADVRHRRPTNEPFWHFWLRPNILLPVFAFTLYAALRSVLHREGLPTACVLYLVGNQGYGKTTAAKRLCALWRNPLGQYANVYDAHSTEAAMRNALADARDQVVLLDDICRSSNRTTQRKRMDLAATLVRAAANEIPVTRMCGKREETTECAASLVITGEFPLEEASDLTRCVIVNVDHQLTGGDDSDRDAAASALVGFLQWFAEHFEAELDRLRAEYHDFKTKKRSHREERLQISLWELGWVFESFLRFTEDVGAASHRAAEQIDTILMDILRNIYRDTLQRIDRLKTRAFVTLASVIMTGAKAKKFSHFQHNGCLCVTATGLTTYLRQVSGNPQLTINDVTSALRQQHLLRMDHTGKSTRKVRGMRVLTIPLEKLK